MIGLVSMYIYYTGAEIASQKWGGGGGGGAKKKVLKFTIIFHRLKLCSLLFTHNCTIWGFCFFGG